MKTHIDEVSGLFIAEDPLKMAREILRLLDQGETKQLSALLAAADLRTRLDCTSEVLNSETTDL